MTNKMKIAIFSISCCYPAHAGYDEQYITRVKEALNKTGVEAKISLIPASDAVFGMKFGLVRKMWPLLNQFGAAAAPALFINGELALYGGIPTIEKLIEVIEKARKNGGRGQNLSGKSTRKTEKEGRLGVFSEAMKV